MTELTQKIAEFAAGHGMFPPEGLVIAAVSGGADSMCLLSALIELSADMGFSVAAAHFNHRLRGSASDEDAAFVARYCADRGIPLFNGAGDVRSYAERHGAGIEEAARTLRYAFFYETVEKAGAAGIATAHTADDNAETLLFNLLRGAGLKGLGGIPPVRDCVLRPMLTVTRREVLEYLADRCVPYVEDATNKLDIYSRNILRHRVIPVLTALNPRFAEAATKAALLLREDEAYLSGLAADYIAEHGENGALSARDLAGLPRALSGRIIRQFAAEKLPDVRLGAGHVEDILRLCAADDPSGRISLPGGTAYREYDRLVFSREFRDGGFLPVTVPVDGVAEIPELGLVVRCRKLAAGDLSADKFPAGENPPEIEKINKSFTTFLFKYDSIYGNIVIRPRKTGDKIKLFGTNSTKTLKKLFIEKKIPARRRAMIPVIADDAGILAVRGVGCDARAAVGGTADCGAGDVLLEVVFEETGNEK